MELIANLFGKSPNAQNNRSSGQIDGGERFRTRMSQTERTQAQRARKIEDDIQKSKQAALSASKNGQKAQARQHLKRKALLERQLQTLYAYRSNNTALASQAESTQMAADNVSLMRDGANYQKEILKQTGDIDDIEETMQDVQEVMEEGNDIIEAVSRPLDLGGVIPELDDDQLDDAMDELEQELNLELQDELEEETPHVSREKKNYSVSSPSSSSSKQPTLANSDNGGDSNIIPPNRTNKKNRYKQALEMLDD